jgi:hypothetical protein
MSSPVEISSENGHDSASTSSSPPQPPTRFSSFGSDAQDILKSLPPIQEGFVMKKADDSKFRLINPWKKRFLRLNALALSYAECAEELLVEKKRKGIVRLTATMNCSKGHEALGFDVFEMGGKAKVLILRLKAFSRSESDIWISAINDAIAALKRKDINNPETGSKIAANSRLDLCHPDNEPGMQFKDPPATVVNPDAPLTDDDIEHIRKKLQALHIAHNDFIEIIRE